MGFAGERHCIRHFRAAFGWTPGAFGNCARIAIAIQVESALFRPYNVCIGGIENMVGAETGVLLGRQLIAVRAKLGRDMIDAKL